ncbi:MAG: hypothetical protein NTX00_01765 [Candidatus Parcubacteria bacterium]|nr:hypothetical protein [Candidatus Parcubacteria bacterium]
MLERLKRKWPYWALAILCLSLLLFLLIRYGEVLTFFLVIPWIFHKLTNLGINEWIAWIFTIPITIFFLWGLKQSLSKQADKKKQGYIILSLLMFAYCLGMYFMQRDYAFDPKTGKPTKCYAPTPYGYEEVPCSWKIHPIFGTTVIPANKELVTSKILIRSDYPKVEKINPTRDMAFFTPDGQPLAWYYQYPDGKIEIFPRPGYHPQFKVVLAPVTPEIVNEIFKQLQAQESTQNIVIHDDASAQTNSQQTGKKIPSLDGLKNLSEELKSLNPNR